MTARNPHAGVARVHPSGRAFQATLSVPGDKSIAHRALFFAALAEGESRIHGFPGGADNRATAGMMAALGADVNRHEVAGEAPTLVVRGFGRSPRPSTTPVDVDCLNSGTTTRIGMGIVAGFPVTARFHGDDSLSQRPMRRVVKHLVAMGATVTPDGHADVDRLPLLVRGGRLRDYEVAIETSSAQVKSAILMAGFTSGAGVSVTEPSLSRDHTERFFDWLFPAASPLKRIGTTVALARRAPVSPAFELGVPGDPSSAAFWAALAAVSGGEAIVERVCWNTTRIGFFRAIEAMGVRVAATIVADGGPEPVANLAVSGSPRRSVRIEGPAVVDAIDELPLLALMGMFLPAGEAVTVRDAEELRVKESDRIEATAAVARALGGDVEVYADGLRVGPPPAGAFHRSAAVDAAMDHRIAMGAAIAAVGARSDVSIHGAGAAAVSYPDFWRRLSASGVATVQIED